jgi:hypothetical protein
VTDRGLEPRTNCLRGNCSAIELVGRAAKIIPQRNEESIILEGQIIWENAKTWPRYFESIIYILCEILNHNHEGLKARMIKGSSSKTYLCVLVVGL